MPLLKGALTTTRCQILGTLPTDWEDALAGAWFREPLSPTVKRSAGFCIVDEPTLCDGADLNRWLFQGWVLLGWRIDEKKLDGARFKAELQARTKAWCKANSRDRVPAAAKEEMKEQLTFDMLQRTLPSLKVIEIAISLQNGIALLGTAAEAPLEGIRKALYRATGLRFPADGHLGSRDHPKDPKAFEGAMAVADRSWDPRSVTWSMPGGSSQVLADEDPLRFSRAASAAGFLGWLWGLTEAEDGSVLLEGGERVVLAIQNEVGLAMSDAAHDEVTVRLDQPGASDEARAGLRKGRIPTRLGMWLRREDREYAFTLTGSPFGLKAIKLPTQVKTGSVEEVWLDRAFCYEELVSILEELLLHYVEVCTDPVEGAAAVARWAEGLAMRDDEAGFEEA
jgi:hypothetical protein